MLTKENLIYLKEKQILLDKYIIDTKKIVVDKKIIKKKIIAFLVEVSEFINEYREFKYWSNKPASERSVILEELIDCLHFIISLGIDVNFDFLKFNNKIIKTSNIDTWSINVYRKTLIFEEKFNLESYDHLLDEFLSIMYILKITTDEIINIYNKKNEINFNRQDSGY
ncbi:dUTP diphosphatase [Spiroplasma cantharicola]|uniref:dUTP diphosphatase n=1 Tax=Spiroplasma cantharicola TaxID=362837 RepID=A0A0M3SJG2_9MOLU|nr:dUTP diphosphatase [Spiroplasma cantharicola]ALD66698.1 dUTP diphosphatase [Spiroplasma cantharicola]